MTDFMTAILFQLTCDGEQRERGVQFQSACKLCRESHKSQVWLCFLVLSLLSTSTCAAQLPETTTLQSCLNDLKPNIQRSGAMLYTPPFEDFKENCIRNLLKCYILELIMVIDEEEIQDFKRDCILDFNKNLPDHLDDKTCPPCEAYTLQNITMFLGRLETLLQYLTQKYQ